MSQSIHRREFCTGLAAVSAASFLCGDAWAEETQRDKRFEFNFILSSCMYGYQYVGEIFPEVRNTGAVAIDIWPKIHGNQREQLDDLGEEKFKSMMDAHDISLGCITQYMLGPFRLQEEMRLAQRLGANTIVCGAVGPAGVTGDDLKKAVARFVEQMKPHLEVAEECGITIAIENHANSLVESADSMKWLTELRPSEHLSIAFAPYHLPQDAALLAKLIRELGDSIAMCYAWQHGMGCMKRLPKEQELLQMPGRGELDFQPIVRALADISFSGWTSIFMHPVPRGIPILETAAEVTVEINRARKYLADCIELGE